MLFLTLLGGVNTVWAETVTFTAGTDTSEGTSITKDGITISFTSGVFNRTDNYRCYSGASMTISATSGITMTQIDFTATSSNPMTKFSGDPDVGAWTDALTKTQWTGEASVINFGTTSGQARITEIVVTYTTSGTVTQTVATPTFSPEGGDFTEAQDVTISCTTSGATIYYTTDGMAPTTSSSVYSSAISVEATTTIKAIAVKDGMNNSAVASATYTIITGGAGDSYVIDFENIAVFYTNWIFTNIVGKAQNSNVLAHGGSYFGNTNGKESGSIQTKEKIATPNSLTCYLSKQSTNTTPSSWKIQVSSDGETWTDVAETSAVDMTRGEWKEFSADLSAYTDVYVRVYYSGTTAIRDIDDLTLVTKAPAVATPTFDPADGEYTEAQSVTITCATEGATIYYTTDGTDPSNQSTPYTGAIAVSETTIIKAIAYVGTDASSVATATYTIVEPLSQITIAAAREQATGEVLTAGTVTSVNGRTAYIQDNTAAIVVYGSSNLNVAIGDDITVQGTLSTYNGLLEITSPEITVTSQGNTVEPVVTAIAAISNDNQAKLIKIENATVTDISGQNVTIAQGESTIVVRFNNTNDIKFDVGNVISLTGNIGIYQDNPQIANPREIEIQGQKKFYLMGINDDWTDGIEFDYEGNGVYTLALTNELAAGATFKFKDSDGKWYFSESNGNYEINADNHSNIALQEANTMDNYYINIAGTWTFTITESENGTSLTVDGDWPQPTYYLAGSFATTDAWADDMVEFESQGDGIYTLTKELEANTELKVVNDTQDQWYSTNPAELTKENSTDLQLSTENGSNMLIAPAGTYTFTLDANTMKLTVTGWPNIPFYESFNSTEGTGGNDSEFSGSIATNDLVYDNEGWTSENASGADKCAKIGSSKKGGHLTTPTLSFESGKTYVLTFKAAAWNTDNENTTLLLSATSGTLTNASVELKKAEWTNYTVYMMNTTGEGSIKFYTESGTSRFFLDEIKIEEFEGIPVTIGATGYGTLYYSDVALAVPEGVTASIVTNVEGGKITFEELSDVIPAGTGVVLNANAGDYKFMPVSSSAEAPADNMLKGSDVAEETTGGGKYYMLSLNANSDPSSVGFYYAKENGEAFTNGAHKAYLVVGSSTGAKSFYLFNDAITDGIGAVESTRFNAQGTEIYNLNGQRVSTPQRGIYIINGKKVLVK